MWQLWKLGESLQQIAQLFYRDSAPVRRSQAT